MKLNDYIEKYDTKINALARRCGISEGAIRYALKGNDMRLSIAKKIVAGTHGQVTFEDLSDAIESTEEPKMTKPKKKAK